MLKGINKVLEKYQTVLLIIVGIVVILPFVAFVPGADLFDFFGNSKPQRVETAVNDEVLTSQEINQQLISYSVGSSLRVPQNYGQGLSGNNFEKLVALNRFALIEKLKGEYKFDEISKDEIKTFLKDKLSSLKNAKNFLDYIQRRYGLSPKGVETIIIENIFIEKHDDKIRSQIVVEEKDIKENFIKENTQYSVNSLKLSSSDNKFLDKKAMEYYQKNKQDYSQDSSLKVEYVYFKRNTNESDIANLDREAKNHFNKNKKKYRLESKQQRLGVVGFFIEDFLDVKQNSATRKVYDKMKLEVEKKGFERAVYDNSDRYDFQGTYWGDEEENPFYRSVKNLKKGELSNPLKVSNNPNFATGYYLVQVLDEREGTFTNLAKTVITEELILAKNKKRNQLLSKSLHRSLKSSISPSATVAKNLATFKEKSVKLKLTPLESPFLFQNNPSNAYPKPFLDAIAKLSPQNPLSKVFTYRNSFAIAVYKETGSAYKPFEQVKYAIKEKIYKEQAKKYFEANKEEFTIKAAKYGYAVNFYPDIKKFSVSNIESLKYYKNNKELYDKPQARVKTITVNYRRRNKQEMKAKIEQIRQDINANKISFSQAVKKYSNEEEASQKDNWVTQDRHLASEIIFATKAGKVSEVFEGRSNFQIFKIEETSKNTPYPRVKEDIINRLKRDKAIADARGKKDRFFTQIDAIVKNSKGKNNDQHFLKLARDNGYRAITVSTKSNYGLRSVAQDLALRDKDNPIIINDRDFWVGCYSKTQEERIPNFEEISVQQKVINVVNKEEATETVNKKFNEIFAKLNQAPNAISLSRQLNFEKEGKVAFKDLPQSYRTALEEDASRKVFSTKDSRNEHIIFVVINQEVPSDDKFEAKKEEFSDKYNDEIEQKTIEKFYQDFANKNDFSL